MTGEVWRLARSDQINWARLWLSCNCVFGRAGCCCSGKTQVCVCVACHVAGHRGLPPRPAGPTWLPGTAPQRLFCSVSFLLSVTRDWCSPTVKEEKLPFFKVVAHKYSCWSLKLLEFNICQIYAIFVISQKFRSEFVVIFVILVVLYYYNEMLVNFFFWISLSWQELLRDTVDIDSSKSFEF